MKVSLIAAHRRAPRRALLLLAAACGTVLLLANVGLAQRPDGRPDRSSDGAPAKEQEKPEDKEAEDKPAGQKDEKAKDSVIAITGGDVITVTREVIRRGVVLVRNGKIAEVGQGIEPPEGARIIDATGMYVAPGFIALSLSRVGLETPSDDNGKFADHLNPFDQNVKIALGVGITTGVATAGGGRGRFRRSANEYFPGLELPPDEAERRAAQWNIDFGDPNTSVCQCCGLPILPTEPIERPRPQPLEPQRHAVIKMSYGDLTGMLVRETAFFHVPSNSLEGGLNRDSWRDMVGKARQYLKDVEAHEKAVASGEKSQPPRKPVSDEVIALVKKEIRLRTDANSRDEIGDMIQLAQELDYKLLLDGVAEGWTMPERLSESETPVVITPRRRRNPDFAREDSTGSNIESSRIFEEAGVPFAVDALSNSISLNGIAGRDLTSLPLEAAFAVRGGCSEKTALEALTIVPARILGLEDRLGSIEAGKDADLLILDGPPLDYRTYVQTALVNGRIVYEKNVDNVFP